jgi:ATP-dependent exoDNAse (exonuclease V) alpha subunit
VIDEAGRVDLHASDALLTLARETGAGLSMVGDHLQAAPVGHAGAMAALTRRATAVVELNTVHRFADPAYGQLTLRLREPSHDQALDVAAELDERGHVLRADSRDAARAAMVDRYFAWTTHRRHIALVTASNDEADAINDAIQRRRVDAGELDPAVLTVGAEEQRILVGDTVQTRRNDSVADVENRATWHVHAIGPHAISLVSVSDPAVRRTVSVEYAVEYLRLAYASTVHGAQGETTDVSIVGPDVDAAGLYVGMTRGRIHNEAIVVATNPRAARAHLAEAMRRGLAEVSVEESRRAAATDLHRAARDPAGSTSSEGPVPASGTRGDWTRRAQRTLRRLSAQAATRNARHHGTPNATDHASLDDQIEQLRHTIESEEHSLEGELSHLAPTTAGHDASSSGLHRTPEGIVGVD